MIALTNEKRTEHMSASLALSQIGENKPLTLITSARSSVSRRKWPILVSFAIVAVGLAFMFAWIPLVLGKPEWYTGGDLWGIFRGAHYVGWGYLGGIYTQGTGIVSFPGIAMLLAPVAIVVSHFHLLESYPPYFFAHPTAALILQPMELVLACTVVFATDALAQELDTSRRNRILLSILVGVLAWPVAAIWGHAEDVVAVTFALYALVSLSRARWIRCGWLLGVGILMQPLVALLVPLVLAAAPSGIRLRVLVRASVLSAVLVGVAFVGNPQNTYRALVEQPTPPSVNHATPWIGLAPTITPAMNYVSQRVHSVEQTGHRSFATVTSTVRLGATVAGGPGRSIDLVLAVIVGLIVARRRPGSREIVWWALVVLSSRCFFEAVMTPYYLAPPLIVGLVLAARAGGWRLSAVSAISLGSTVFAYLRFGPWVWWLPIVLSLSVITVIDYPTPCSQTGREIERRQFSRPDVRVAAPAGVESNSVPVSPDDSLQRPGGVLAAR